MIFFRAPDPARAERSAVESEVKHVPPSLDLESLTGRRVGSRQVGLDGVYPAPPLEPLEVEPVRILPEEDRPLRERRFRRRGVDDQPGDPAVAEGSQERDLGRSPEVPALAIAGEWARHPTVVSQEVAADIAAMKIEAIGGRGSRKDFVDVRVLGRAGVTIDAALDSWTSPTASTAPAGPIATIGFASLRASGELDRADPSVNFRPKDLPVAAIIDGWVPEHLEDRIGGSGARLLERLSTKAVLPGAVAWI